MIEIPIFAVDPPSSMYRWAIQGTYVCVRIDLNVVPICIAPVGILTLSGDLFPT